MTTNSTASCRVLRDPAGLGRYRIESPNGAVLLDRVQAVDLIDMGFDVPPSEVTLSVHTTADEEHSGDVWVDINGVTRVGVICDADQVDDPTLVLQDGASAAVLIMPLGPWLHGALSDVDTDDLSAVIARFIAERRTDRA